MTRINDRILLSPPGRTRRWLQRGLFTAGALVFIVGAFFFITVVLVAGALLAVVVAVRWWWVMRRVRAALNRRAALEGEYTVVQRDHALHEIER